MHISVTTNEDACLNKENGKSFTLCYLSNTLYALKQMLLHNNYISVLQKFVENVQGEHS